MDEIGFSKNISGKTKCGKIEKRNVKNLLKTKSAFMMHNTYKNGSQTVIKRC